MTDIMQYVDRGGIIVTILIGLNILGFTIMLWKLIALSMARYQKEKMVQKTLAFIKENNQDFNKKTLQNSIEIQSKKLEFGLGTVKTIASIAPLLGLLGTVVGVLTAFDAIAQHGLGDPSIFSGGISIALITTVAGLIVAIPHYVGYNYLVGVLDNLELKLEKDVLERL